MRVVLQRVREAAVRVRGEIVGQIGPGLLLFIGIGPDDGDAEIAWMAEKIPNLRIFPDEHGRMGRSLLDVGGQILAVSQFTLYADCRKGRRPSFVGAAPPGVAEPLYERLCEAFAARGVHVQRGVFGAHMEVSLVNDGPVTLIVAPPS